MDNITIYILDNLNISEEKLNPCINQLSGEDLSKYNGFKSKNKQKAFLMGRLLLKKVLHNEYSFYNANFTRNKYGKPFLVDNQKGVYFNLSYTEGVISCAISENVEVGLDIEKEKIDMFEVMDLVFLPSEYTLINQCLSLEDKTSVFFYFWTRKEAFMKLSGKGFSLNPLSFNVCNDVTNDERGIIRIKTIKYMPDNTLSLAYRSDTNIDHKIIKLTGQEVISFYQ